MSKFFLIPAALCLTACAATTEDQTSDIVSNNDAIEDFIEVSDLKEVDAIRSFDTPGHKTVSARYIIVRDRKKQYLLTFRRRCHEYRETDVTPDVRYDRSTIRARFDTYRGCRIDRIFELTPGQVTELEALAEAEYE